MLSRIKNTQWHRLLAKVLEELLTPLGVTVLTEVPVMAGPPEADIILIRRHGVRWTDQQKSWLADGLRDTSAKQLLIEFKYAESLNEDAFLQVLGYDRWYKKHQRVGRGEVQSVLMAAKTPGSDIMERLGFKTNGTPGVYVSEAPFVHVLRVILLNELADQPHNAFFKCFASHIKEKQKAFATIQRLASRNISEQVNWLVFGLRRLVMRKRVAEPEVEGWTPESVIQLGRFLESRDKHFQEEAAAMLIRQLHRKFGQVAESVTQKVTGAKREVIETWGENILFANSLDEVFAP